MDLDFPNAGDIDSLCHAVEQTGDDTPAAISPRCKDEAVTWFVTPDGTRVYVCRDHALEPFRFPAAGRSRDDLPDDYNDLRSLAASEGISLQSPEAEELENRLLEPADPESVEANPRVVRCSTCTRLTLTRDASVVEGRCKSCENGVPELDPADYAVTTPPEG
jgi:hypothetical protein